MKIEITQDQIDELVIKGLQAMYRTLTDDMIAIVTMETIPAHRQEDFEDQKKTRKHIKEVLSYYMIKEDFDKWVKKTGVIND